MRIYLASIIFGLLVLIPNTSIAQETIFTHADCTVVYSLKRSADKYFNDEIAQLTVQVHKKGMHFIDLNNWRKTPPHIEVSGRSRNKLRQLFDLPKGVNQAVVVNDQGQVLSRYSGSVTLVNVLIDCH